jgi:hypothetical protein
MLFVHAMRIVQEPTLRHRVNTPWHPQSGQG